MSFIEVYIFLIVPIGVLTLGYVALLTQQRANRKLDEKLKALGYPDYTSCSLTCPYCKSHIP